MSNFDQPMGGTELMYAELKKRISQSYFEKFSIFNYPCYADFNKPTIYWNQLSYDQEAVQFLSDLDYVKNIEHFVFVSNWQAEIYRKHFNLEGDKIKVIKNACSGVTPDLEKSNEKTKICYTSTPWRGLNVLLKAWEILKPQTCELHIFSSTKIYGSEFSKNAGSQYDHLYEKCKQLPNVVYRGAVNNAVLRSELSTFDILAYPSTFEETSCISVIDALSAGLKVVCSNIGALPETTEGWADMYPFIKENDKHAAEFAKILKNTVVKYKNGEYKDQLKEQVSMYAPKWSWDKRIEEWNTFLNDVAQTK